MAADTAKKRATYRDVLDAPSHLVAEVLNGELHTHPRPSGPYAEAASVLGMDIGGAFHRAKTVEVFRLDADTYRLVAVHGDSEVVRLEPFDAIELTLSALWPSRASE